MMAPEYYTFTGRDGEVIPDHITHVRMAKALKFVRARALFQHPNIREVICHDGVEKIERKAFYNCPRLRRVIMPGVEEVEKNAFYYCTALTYIECSELEIIGEHAFQWCISLRSIDLPSIKIVEKMAFSCTNLTNVKFGKDLESIRENAFFGCPSLERITLPLKDGIIIDDATFQRCVKLNHVDLVEGVHETVAALLLEEWKDDMNKETELINQILDATSVGNICKAGGKAEAIRKWIRKFLHKYIYYKAEHRRYVNEAADTLKLTLPHDIVLKNILPFVELPSDTFVGED